MLQNPKVVEHQQELQVENDTTDLMWQVTIKTQAQNTQYIQYPQGKKTLLDPLAAKYFL